MAGFNTWTLVIISRLPHRLPFHSFWTQEPQVPVELTFSTCFAPENTSPNLSSPGTNSAVSGAVIFLVAIWNYKLLRRKPQNQAKWLKRLPRGWREVFTPQRGPIYLYFFNHREFSSFFIFCSAVKMRHSTKMAMEAGPELQMMKGRLENRSPHHSLGTKNGNSCNPQSLLPFTLPGPTLLPWLTPHPVPWTHHLLAGLLPSVPCRLYCQTFPSHKWPL